MRRVFHWAAVVVAVTAIPRPALADHLGDRGRALYAEQCAACHGDRLQGAPDWRVQKPDGEFPAPPHDASGHTWHHGDAMLIDYIALGGQEALRRMGVTRVKSGMPAFGEVLSAHEIAAVLDFIKAQWPEEIRRMQAERTRAAQ